MGHPKSIDINAGVPKTGENVWSSNNGIKKLLVVGENTRSIFLGTYPGQQLHSAERMDKADWRDGKTPDGYHRTEEEINQLQWLSSHRSRITDAVLYRATPIQMAKIADILGYDESVGLPRPVSLILNKTEKP